MAKRHQGFIGKLLWGCEALMLIGFIAAVLLYLGGVTYCQIIGGCQNVETSQPDNSASGSGQ